MQQAALTDIFSKKHWKGQSNWYLSLGLRAQDQLQTLDMQSKWCLNIQRRRVQKVILNQIHHFCTEKHCNAVALYTGDPLELPAVTPTRQSCHHPRSVGEGLWRLQRYQVPPWYLGWAAGGRRSLPMQTTMFIQIFPPSVPVRVFMASVHTPQSILTLCIWLWGFERPHCWFFCLGLCIWLLVSKYNGKEWFLGI